MLSGHADYLHVAEALKSQQRHSVLRTYPILLYCCTSHAHGPTTLYNITLCFRPLHQCCQFCSSVTSAFHQCSPTPEFTCQSYKINIVCRRHSRSCLRESLCLYKLCSGFHVLSLSQAFRSSARVSVAVQGGHDPAGRGAEGCALRSSHEPFILGVRL